MPYWLYFDINSTIAIIVSSSYMPNLRHECLPSNRATKTVIGLKTDDIWVKLSNKNENSSNFALFFFILFLFTFIVFVFMDWSAFGRKYKTSVSLAEVKSHDFLKNLWWQDPPPSGFQALHSWRQVVNNNDDVTVKLKSCTFLYLKEWNFNDEHRVLCECSMKN